MTETLSEFGSDVGGTQSHRLRKRASHGLLNSPPGGDIDQVLGTSRLSGAEGEDEVGQGEPALSQEDVQAKIDKIVKKIHMQVSKSRMQKEIEQTYIKKEKVLTDEVKDLNRELEK